MLHMCVCMHSRFIENHPIRILEDGLLISEVVLSQALSHFVSRLGECGLPLYKLLKKSDSFCWTEETQNALDDLKALITMLAILASPEPDETLLLYVVVTT
jgi:hypothetical protein